LSGRSWRAVVFVNGVTRRGRHHPDVERLARALARAGYLAAVPDPPGLRQGTLPLRTLAATTAVVRSVGERPDVRGGRVALCGVSVGASLGLLAAEQPSPASRIRVVAAIAPYTDLVQIARLTTTGVYMKHGRLERYRTKAFAALVIARSLAASLTPPPAGPRPCPAARQPRSRSLRPPLRRAAATHPPCRHVALAARRGCPLTDSRPDRIRTPRQVLPAR
jgi:pimeloyl-ACP methyl ester carboxylesterase